MYKRQNIVPQSVNTECDYSSIKKSRTNIYLTYEDFCNYCRDKEIKQDKSILTYQFHSKFDSTDFPAYLADSISIITYIDFESSKNIVLDEDAINSFSPHKALDVTK